MTDTEPNQVYTHTVERNGMNGVTVVSVNTITGEITKRYIPTPKKSGMIPRSHKRPKMGSNPGVQENV